MDVAAAAEGLGGTCSSVMSHKASRVGTWGSPGTPAESPSHCLLSRPLKNSSDGALMDDNQNEWGDGDLETKKFRVSRDSLHPLI